MMIMTIDNSIKLIASVSFVGEVCNIAARQRVR